MLPRILFLCGSVLVLFGLWKFASPWIYEGLKSEPRQAVVFLVVGILLVIGGKFLEKRESSQG